jgi:hypothetical protein
MLRRQLTRQGSDTTIAQRAATLDDLRRLADRNGLGAQLQRTLRRRGRP